MKNKMMRAATLLLVLTLMTSCFVGSTFAKYTTSNTGTDSARVAYWGFDTPATITFDLFDVSDDTGIGADGLIAPGSTKTINFDFVNATDAGNKAPEVAYKVKVDTTGSVAPTGNLDDQIVWKLNGTDYADWADFIAAIKALSGDASGTKEYAPNAALPDVIKNGATGNSVGWEWVFEDGSDAADTALGNLGTDTVTLAISITVEQLNTYTATP